MSDENVPETTEGRKARLHKVALHSLMEELVGVMEEARKDGFIVEFSIAMTPEQTYQLAHLSLVKRW